jgi:hypothetical protein
LTKTPGPAPNSGACVTVDELVTQYLAKYPTYQLEEINRYDDQVVGDYTFATIRVQVPGAGKKVLQASCPGAWWELKTVKGQQRLLYNLPAVRAVENILVVEGEKCVHAFTALNIEGWAATTSPGGAKSADMADWNVLKDKNVYIWRDYDVVGKRYQDDVLKLLNGTNTTRTVEVDPTWWPELKEGDDLVDWLATLPVETDTVHDLLHILEQAVEWSPAAVFQRHLIDIAEGRYRLVSFPTLPVFSRLTQAGLPGKSTLIIGNPGSAKSFLAMELGWTLNEVDVPTASLFLEDGQIDYQKRCAAQMLERSEYVDGEWQEANPERAQEMFNSVVGRLDTAFHEHITCLEAEMWTPANVLDWMTDRANEGYRMIILDPVTAMEMTGKQWITDQNFVMTAQKITTAAGLSLVMTTHQKSGVKHVGIDGAAGGQAWSRFTHTNVWLRSTEGKGPMLSRVGEVNGQQQVIEHKRELYITKARNGPGAWQHIAVDLDPRTLRFNEYGVILGEVRPGEANVNSADPQF